MAKKRLDNLLVEMGLFETKSKAQASILAGKVKVDGEKITKAGFQVNDKKGLPLIDIESMPYVSRGGFKLEKAIKSFNIDLKNKICLDAGASTGGFTDCMLQNGASKVYAVDVGYGQLDWKLRSDDRVVTIERTNIKNCSIEDVYAESEKSAQFLAADLSFISLNKVLDNMKNLLKEYELVLLIKPQFEAGRENIEKGGVVRNKSVHVDVINKVIEYAQGLNLFAQDLAYSPITGPAGNIEYVIYLKSDENHFDDDKIQSIVDEAFSSLSK